MKETIPMASSSSAMVEDHLRLSPENPHSLTIRTSPLSKSPAPVTQISTSHSVTAAQTAAAKGRWETSAMRHVVFFVTSSSYAIPIRYHVLKSPFQNIERFNVVTTIIKPHGWLIPVTWLPFTYRSQMKPMFVGSYGPR